MIRVKGFSGFENSEGNMNKFAHCSADNLHFAFAVAGQALTESANNRVVLFGDHCWQKQRFTNSGIAGL